MGGGGKVGTDVVETGWLRCVWALDVGRLGCLEMSELLMTDRWVEDGIQSPCAISKVLGR